MPCRSDGYEDITLSDTRNELHKVTRLLCELVSQVVGKNQVKIRLSKELTDWWDTHQEFDRARLAREAEEKHLEHVRAVALGKLSPEEKKILGLR